jgi:hypothetical protein
LANQARREHPDRDIGELELDLYAIGMKVQMNRKQPSIQKLVPDQELIDFLSINPQLQETRQQLVTKYCHILTNEQMELIDLTRQWLFKYNQLQDKNIPVLLYPALQHFKHLEAFRDIDELRKDYDTRIHSL